ncbi:hypothetical protein SCHIN_v1c03410 [Spiroplasma chinense]|uniref:Lipoprotein n=1 Tax=Spiroplasma chinense TaxID=216932 RepID=A0A5B9Y365_9MOLU|nr:hypothetical protein [Spiroplasma chinense]QEH61538.1 hypothetical protein SCHIN_v1c03410 [Spiroplasma chinense]
MKKLMSIIGALGILITGASQSCLYMNNNKEEFLRESNKISRKINLSEQKFEKVELDIEGVKDIAIIEIVAIQNLIEKPNKTPIQADFLRHYLEQKEQYVTLGAISVLPKVGQKITFNYNVVALPSNYQYSGIANFTIILTNSGIQTEIPLEANENISYSDNYRLWTGGWVWDSYTSNKKFAVVNWRKFADTWTEF